MEYYHWDKLRLVIVLWPRDANLNDPFEVDIKLIILWWQEDLIMMRALLCFVVMQENIVPLYVQIFQELS